MSTDFRGLRPASNDPLLQIFTELQKRFAKFITTQQVELIDSDNEDIYSNGQDMESVIKYHTIQHEQLFEFNKNFYPAFEPDGQKLTLHITGAAMGNTLKDRSGFNNNAVVYGDPVLVESAFDPGTYTYGTKSTAIRFNRNGAQFENAEYLRVPDNANLRVSGLVTGFSIFVRIQLYNLSQQNGRDRTIFEKIDDSTPNNATMLKVGDHGNLIFVVKKGGIVTAKMTADATVSTNTVYDIFVTFAVSGSVMHIYVNGIDQTLSNFTGAINWQTTLTDFDYYVFQRGPSEDVGFVNGDLLVFKRYQEMVVSSIQVTNHWNNKVTISPHEIGTTMITNYWATMEAAVPPPSTSAYMTDAYDSSAYET